MWHARGFCFSTKSPLPMAAHRLTSATFNGKVLKSSNNLGEEWMFDYRKDHTVVTDTLGRTEVYGFDENRELVYRIDADGQRSDSERDDYGHITVERAPLGRENRQ